MKNLYGLNRLTSPATQHRIYIISGEEFNYHRELYTGKRTQRAIKARLTRERCGGQRWARAEMLLDYDNAVGPVVMDMETGEYRN